MERKLWGRLYRLVTEVAHQLAGRLGVVHSDRWIVLAYLWAVLHDRPTCWASRPENWPTGLRPAGLPSQPTLSRRLRTAEVRALLGAVEARLRGDPAAGLVKLIDAKPLAIGGDSKDPEAAWGRAAHCMAKGSKLFASWGRSAMPLRWRVGPMDLPEPTAATNLIGHLHGGGYLLGDAPYDSNRLYDLAGQHGHQLVAPPKRPGAGPGHRRHSTHRLRALHLLRGAFGRSLYAGRQEVERDFAHLCSFGGGLGPLPSWVRRLHRVRLWVQAKLIINGVRAMLHQQLAP